MYIIYFQYSYTFTHLRLASGREMASYNLENFDMESPYILTFIFNSLSVRKWSFFGNKKNWQGFPCIDMFLNLEELHLGQKKTISSEN